MAPKPPEIINTVKINTAKISPSSLPCAKSDVALTFLRLFKSVHRLGNRVQFRPNYFGNCAEASPMLYIIGKVKKGLIDMIFTLSYQPDAAIKPVEAYYHCMYISLRRNNQSNSTSLQL